MTNVPLFFLYVHTDYITYVFSTSYVLAERSQEFRDIYLTNFHLILIRNYFMFRLQWTYWLVKYWVRHLKITDEDGLIKSIQTQHLIFDVFSNYTTMSSHLTNVIYTKESCMLQTKWREGKLIYRRSEKKR